MGTWNHKRTKIGYCIFVFAIVYHIMFRCVHVAGKSISSDKAIKLAKHKGTIKTIQSEDGDVIDCVDIYKQPAFDHLLLKNHTIQMKPSSYPTGKRDEKSEPELFQSWHKNGQCPEGTIPIIRAHIHNSARTKAFAVPHRKNINDINVAKGHEYAQVSVVNGNYFGATAWLNVWTPATFNGEFSLAQIWVLAGHLDETNAIEAGWMTNSGQKQTIFFIYWTKDGYQSTGCYNLDCPGFVQTSKKISLGAALTPVSTYGAKLQHEISINIHKDKQSGNWWLRMQNNDLGYWPGSIFTRLSDRAESINWGGEIVNSELHGRHTSTQMGSGHFSGEGFAKASYFRNIGYVDDSGAVRDAENLVSYVTRPECYDLQIPNKNSFGTHFYYGGPGFSDKCK